MDGAGLPFYAAAAGVLSHWFYFIRGEHHVQGPLLLRLALVLPCLLLGGLWSYGGLDAISAGTLTLKCVSLYYAALWTSILVYRIFFHRLRRFPGPFMFKTSKLWHVYKLAPNSDNYKQLDALHRQYGDFVRTGKFTTFGLLETVTNRYVSGPCEVSIFDPNAVPILLGPGTKCTKAPWYDANLPYISMHTLRDKSAHDKRRRIWDRGFNAKALRQYEDRILRYSKELLRQISSRSGQTLNASKFFHFYSFDVMGDIAFGKSFGMLETGKSNDALNLLAEGMKPLGVLTPAPWIFCVLTSIPGLSAGFKTFVAWCAEQIQQRKKMEMEVPDVMSWIIDAAAQASPNEREKEEQLLESDSRLIIVAGSDTTAATLTYAFYRLAQNPEHVTKLRAELDPLRGSDGEYNFKDLQTADYLNGVINETLRLHPPVPSGTLRVTPPEGIMVGQTFIPGDVTVVSPTYTVGRLESAFERATEFVPERWYSAPGMIKNKNAFAPFALGPYSCIGKQLALMELRSVIALLVTGFNVYFAPGESGSRLINDSKDFFTITISDLDLVFAPRKTT
ncbi:hypothetical protein PV08_08216 [Exophiala spinifera]|uniref:Uncharacterized protein n=1 Tax=Exophiala spinifera TaxID=91928 RepID=A0A0D2BPM7_9EURO|nr:uncharacterized protein PV08_08216 [Exophiala spinifera]KIW13029.1 hypothetical protein PV08_08216 [Exophiala spinifera]